MAVIDVLSWIENEGKDVGDRAGGAVEESLDRYMADNAKQMVRDEIFLSVANQTMTAEDFSMISAMMELNGDSLEEQAVLWAKQDGGTMSKAHARKIADAYIKMLGGLDSYGDAALDEMASLYADDPARLAQARNGLGKAMSAAVMPVARSMKDLQGLYGVFGEEDMERVREMSFAGIGGAAMEPMTDEELEELDARLGAAAEGTSPFGFLGLRRTEPAKAAEAGDRAAGEDQAEDQAVREDVPATEADGAEPAQEAGAEAPASDSKTASRRRGIYTDEQIAAMEEARRGEDEAFEDMMLGRLSRARKI